MLKALTFLMAFIIVNVCSGQGYHDMISYNVGMVNLTVAENESSIKQTDTSVTTTDTSTKGSSSAVSAISFQLSWEFKTYSKLAYFTKLSVPLMSGQGTGVFGGDVGFSMYLNPLGAKYSYVQNGTTLVIIPKFKYYWGAFGGTGYVVYNTESARKSDVFFNLGVHGGMVYSMGDRWGFKAEIAASRTTGVATTGIMMNLFMGASYYL